MNENLAIFFAIVISLLIVIIVVGIVVAWIIFLRKKMIKWGLKANSYIRDRGDDNDEE